MSGVGEAGWLGQSYPGGLAVCSGGSHRGQQVPGSQCIMFSQVGAVGGATGRTCRIPWRHFLVTFAHFKTDM